MYNNSCIEIEILINRKECGVAMLPTLSSKGIKRVRRHIPSPQSTFKNIKNSTNSKNASPNSKTLIISVICLVLFISFYLIFRLKYFGWFQTILVFVLAVLLFLAINFKKKIYALKILGELIGILLGAIVFLSIFDIAILNTSYDDWLLVEGDMKVYYYGWLAYRQENFQFPPGKIVSIGYPQTSIVFTDSIPLIAMFIKPLNGILPSTFQYFGLWIFLCYLLMGYFSFKLLKLYSKKLYFLIPASLFFILNPILTQRYLNNHFALMGHFLIIIAFYLFLKKREHKDIFKWVLLISISLLIHLYIYAMVFVIFLFYYLAIWKRKNLFRYIIHFILILLLQLFIAYTSGYFVGSINETAKIVNPEFGTCASDINSLFNPFGYSRFFDGLPTKTSNRDIFNYLGFPVILVFLSLLPFAIRNVANKKMAKKVIWITIPTLLLVLFSFSNEIRFNKTILFKYDFPPFLIFLTQFGASARFLWPCYYLILIFIFYTLSRFERIIRISSLIITILLCIQIYELSSIYSEATYISTFEYDYENPLEDPIWAEISKSNHELALIEVDLNAPIYYDFTIIAIKNKLNLANVRLARSTSEQDLHVKKRILEFYKGELEEGVMYVSSEKNFERARPNLERLNYSTFWVTDFVISYKNPSIKNT